MWWLGTTKSPDTPIIRGFTIVCYNTLEEAINAALTLRMTSGEKTERIYHWSIDDEAITPYGLNKDANSWEPVISEKVVLCGPGDRGRSQDYRDRTIRERRGSDD